MVADGPAGGRGCRGGGAWCEAQSSPTGHAGKGQGCGACHRSPKHHHRRDHHCSRAGAGAGCSVSPRGKYGIRGGKCGGGGSSRGGSGNGSGGGCDGGIGRRHVGKPSGGCGGGRRRGACWRAGRAARVSARRRGQGALAHARRRISIGLHPLSLPLSVVMSAVQASPLPPNGPWRVGRPML